MAIPMDPKTAQSSPSQDNSSVPAPVMPHQTTKIDQPLGSAGGGKEMEGGIGLGSFEIPELAELGKDVELPKEVERAGVQVTPTNVTLPPNVRKAGVKVVPQTVSIQPTAQTQTVPLTDDQIAQGMTQNVTSSWRWLAEWCIRKLKQMHVFVKRSGGKLLRTQN